MKKTALLGGPYIPPSLWRGDRTTCLYRDTAVVITSWSNARISWPRCRALGHRGGSGLLVTEDLVRAIRAESAEALKYWFGVGTSAVWAWRKAFDVRQWGTEGSQRLHQVLSEKGGAKSRGKKQPQEMIRRRLATRKQRGVRYVNRYAETGWKPEDLALLGKVPDEELAERLGRTVNEVRVRRAKLRIRSARDRRKSHQSPPGSPALWPRPPVSTEGERIDPPCGGDGRRPT